MGDPTLHGNGEPCPACALRREADPWQAKEHPCNLCGGTGRIAWTVPDIIARHVAWAREHHWPEFDRRNAQ